MPPENDRDIGRLENRSGHVFARRELLLTALTHASAGPDNNERMEFLGGSLHLESGQGTGATVTLRLPLAAEEVR